MPETKKAFPHNRSIKIGTRESTLALLQTERAKQALEENFSPLKIEIVPLTTRGDKVQDRSIAEVGSRGVFVKELEEALLDHRVDLVVHSLKDLPTDLPEGLALAAVLDRADARDVVVSLDQKRFEDLPPGSKIATSSRRRSAQLKHLRSDLEFIDIRGNIPTRLKKHDEGLCDAMILAAAGLLRLGLAERISEYLSYETSTPAAGQGALAVECRAEDLEIVNLVAAIDDATVRAEITAERAFLEKLGGGCSVPIGAIAQTTNQGLRLLGCVASADGKKLLRSHVEGKPENATTLGIELANSMLDQGASRLLAQFVNIPITISPP